MPGEVTELPDTTGEIPIRVWTPPSTELDHSFSPDPILEQALEIESYGHSLQLASPLDEHYVQGIGATTAIFLPNGYLQQVPRTYQRTVGLDVRYRW